MGFAKLCKYTLNKLFILNGNYCCSNVSLEKVELFIGTAECNNDVNIEFSDPNCNA